MLRRKVAGVLAVVMLHYNNKLVFERSTGISHSTNSFDGNDKHTTMDLIKCTAVSGVETLLMARASIIQPQEVAGVLVKAALLNYIILQLIYIFIYPFYISPLRKLPGPKVCFSQRPS